MSTRLSPLTDGTTVFDGRFKNCSSIEQLRTQFDPNRTRLTALPGLAEAMLIPPTPAELTADKNAKPKKKPIVTRTSVETGQLGGIFGSDRENGLLHTMTFARQAGASAIMPVAGLLEHPSMKSDPKKIKFRDVSELRQFEKDTGIKLAKTSMHCSLWALHTVRHANWARYCRDVVPAAIIAEGQTFTEGWLNEYHMALIDQTVERGVYGAAAFWGLICDPLAHTGYDWVFGQDDLVLDGMHSMCVGSAILRKHCHEKAKSGRQIIFRIGHEIHANSAAQCGSDGELALIAVDYDEAFAWWGDLSHTDEGEDGQTRLRHRAIRGRNIGTHAKTMDEVRGQSKRMFASDFSNRGKRFAENGTGMVNLDGQVSDMICSGEAAVSAYLDNAIGPDEAIFYINSEAEHHRRDLVTAREIELAKNPPGGKRDQVLALPPRERGASARGMIFCVNNLEFTASGGSFTDGMGQS